MSSIFPVSGGTQRRLERPRAQASSRSLAKSGKEITPDILQVLVHVQSRQKSLCTCFISWCSVNFDQRRYTSTAHYAIATTHSQREMYLLQHQSALVATSAAAAAAAVPCERRRAAASVWRAALAAAVGFSRPLSASTSSTSTAYTSRAPCARAAAVVERRGRQQGHEGREGAQHCRERHGRSTRAERRAAWRATDGHAQHMHIDSGR